MLDRSWQVGDLQCHQLRCQRRCARSRRPRSSVFNILNGLPEGTMWSVHQNLGDRHDLTRLELIAGSGAVNAAGAGPSPSCNTARRQHKQQQEQRLQIAPGTYLQKLSPRSRSPRCVSSPGPPSMRSHPVQPISSSSSGHLRIDGSDGRQRPCLFLRSLVCSVSIFLAVNLSNISSQASS